MVKYWLPAIVQTKMCWYGLHIFGVITKIFRSTE